MRSEKPSYLPHIDGLRGVAVLAVMLYHLNADWLPGGFVGVDIFFVISGFVVARSTGALSAPGFGALLASFYAHRVARIVPALIACLLATFLASCLFIPESWLSGSNEKTGLRAYFGLSNMVLAQADGDYFAPKAGFNPFTHTWSLGVEEQFYLLFPCLFAASPGGLRGFSRASFIAGFAASLACAMVLWLTTESDGFYFLVSRFWELAAGVMLLQYLAAQRDEAAFLAPKLRAQLAQAGLAVIVVSLMSITPKSTPFPGSLLPCAAAVALLAGLQCNSEDIFVRRLLCWPPLRQAGRISYSLYLWHWPIFVLFRWTTGLAGFLPSLAAMMLVFATATASHAWIETPLRAAFARTGKSNPVVLAYGVAALLAAYGVSSAMLSLRPVLSLSTVTRHRQDWYQDTPRLDAAFPGCIADLATLRVPGSSAWSAQRTGCALPAKFPHALFVLGDSHATAYTVMLRGFVQQTGAKLALYSSGGCSFFGLRSTDPTRCNDFETASIADISRRLTPGDVIFLPSLRIPRLVQEYASFGIQAATKKMFDPAAARDRQANAERLLPILAGWASQDAAIVFEAPTPNFAAPPFRCADWFDRQNPICAGGTTIARTTIVALRAPVMDAFAAFSQKIPHLHVWDPLPVLCPSETCSAYRDGKPLFFDGDHLSGYGNRVLLPNFIAFLARQQLGGG